MRRTPSIPSASQGFGVHAKDLFFRLASVKEPDHRQPRLLRRRHARPRRRTAEERDELAPLHVLPQAQETAS